MLIEQCLSEAGSPLKLPLTPLAVKPAPSWLTAEPQPSSKPQHQASLAAGFTHRAETLANLPHSPRQRIHSKVHSGNHKQTHTASSRTPRAGPSLTTSPQSPQRARTSRPEAAGITTAGTPARDPKRNPPHCTS